MQRHAMKGKDITIFDLEVAHKMGHTWAPMEHFYLNTFLIQCSKILRDVHKV